MMSKITFPVTAFAGLALILAVGYHIPYCHSEVTSIDEDNSTDTAADIDFDTLSLFGVTPEFAEQFRLNLLKAIEAEEKRENNNLRQGEFGGVSGGFFQGGGNGNAGGGQGGGEQGGEEDEEDEDMPMMMMPGPGAFGVLSGLFGIFSGLGSLNPSRIIQSTVNFFPPGQRQMAQMIVDMLIGYVPPENRTLRPSPRPRTRITTTRLPLNESAMVDSASVVVSATGNDTVVSKDGESSNATLGDASGAQVTTARPINVHKSPANEDDEAEVEKRDTTTPKFTGNSVGSSYKLKPKASTTAPPAVISATDEIIASTPTPAPSSSPS